MGGEGDALPQLGGADGESAAAVLEDADERASALEDFVKQSALNALDARPTKDEEEDEEEEDEEEEDEEEWTESKGKSKGKGKAAMCIRTFKYPNGVMRA